MGNSKEKKDILGITIKWIVLCIFGLILGFIILYLIIFPMYPLSLRGVLIYLFIIVPIFIGIGLYYRWKAS